MMGQSRSSPRRLMVHIVRFCERAERIQLGLRCIVHGNNQFESNDRAFPIVSIRRMTVTVRVICGLSIRLLKHI